MLKFNEKQKRKTAYFSVFSTPFLTSFHLLLYVCWDGGTETQRKRGVREEVRVPSVVGARP